MQQVTLNIPSEKIPVLQSFFKVLGISENKSSLFNRQPKQDAVATEPSSFHPYFDWEFFKSELEYE